MRVTHAWQTDLHGITHTSPRFAVKLHDLEGGRHDGVVSGAAGGEGVGGHFFQCGFEDFERGSLEVADARDFEAGVEFFEALDERGGG